MKEEMDFKCADCDFGCNTLDALHWHMEKCVNHRIKRHQARYTFVVRLFLVVPVIIIMGFVWAFIGLCSIKSLGEVLKKTGENLLKP